MLKRSFVLLLVLALVLSAFTGCAQKTQEPTVSNDNQKEESAPAETTKQPETSKDPQVFTYNLVADPETIDPTLNTSTGGFVIISNTFEGLVNYDENLKPIPGVAESWTVSDDGYVWTFKLREDAKWSDGKPVTASDFEYAWKRAVTPETGCDYAYQFDLVKNGKKCYTGETPPDELGVKAVDERTLEVTLEAAASYMIEIFGFPTLYPVRKDMVEKDPEGWAFNPETFVCNGAFKLSSYKQNDVMTLVPNEEYWDKDNIKLDEINFVFITEQSTALSAFEAGDVDGIDEVPNQEIPRLQSESDEFIIAPHLGTYFYSFNVTKPPFDNVKVREAFTKAIDRNAIVSSVTLGGQVPATGLVPPGIMTAGEDFRKAGGDYGISATEAQVEEAQKILAEAGYPNGEGFPKVTLKYNTSENHKKVAEAIQEMWNKNLNVEVEIENLEWRVYIPVKQNGDYTVARGGWFGDYNHPMTFLDLFLSDSGNNDAQWKNEEFDKLVHQAKLTTDDKKAAELMHKAEDIFLNDWVIMPVYYYTHPMMMKKHVKGWYRSPLGQMYFKNAYIEK